MCIVTNVGTTGGVVKLELVDVFGVVLDTHGPLTRGPGLTRYGLPHDFSLELPTFCRITIPSSTRLRGSFSYFNTSDAPTVIRAE